MMRAYVQRGELRIEWRDVNIYGENSERAARASLAAAMQGEPAAMPPEANGDPAADPAAEAGADPEASADPEAAADLADGG